MALHVSECLKPTCKTVNFFYERDCQYDKQAWSELKQTINEITGWFKEETND
jgi:phage FluMu protein Com